MGGKGGGWKVAGGGGRGRFPRSLQVGRKGMLCACVGDVLLRLCPTALIFTQYTLLLC